MRGADGACAQIRTVCGIEAAAYRGVVIGRLLIEIEANAGNDAQIIADTPFEIAEQRGACCFGVDILNLGQAVEQFGNEGGDVAGKRGVVGAAIDIGCARVDEPTRGRRALRLRVLGIDLLVEIECADNKS